MAHGPVKTGTEGFEFHILASSFLVLTGDPGEAATRDLIGHLDGKTTRADVEGSQEWFHVSG